MERDTRKPPWKNRKDHWRVPVMSIHRFLGRLPFTLMTLVTLVMVALTTNTHIQPITQHWLARAGFAPNDLWYGRLERIFTSALVTAGGRVFWEALFWVAFAIGWSEWMTGWKRTAATFWGVHLRALVLLSLVVSLALHQLRYIGLEASEVAWDVGPSAGYFGVLGLDVARLKRPWHLLAGGALFAVFVFVLFLPPSPGESARLKFSADLAHLLLFLWVGSLQSSRANHSDWNAFLSIRRSNEIPLDLARFDRPVYLGGSIPLL